LKPNLLRKRELNESFNASTPPGGRRFFLATRS